jgi:1,4-alpha-glucan branching enzyme
MMRLIYHGPDYISTVPYSLNFQVNDIKKQPVTVNTDQNKIIAATHHDPFSYLGLHRDAESACLRVYAPQSRELFFGDAQTALIRQQSTDFFEWSGPSDLIDDHEKLTRIDNFGQAIEFYDPYSFPPQIADFDLYLFGEGKHWNIYRVLGAHHKVVDGIAGILFATWAPNAGRVSVTGDFNQWDGRIHPMRSRGDSGVWELFIPGLHAGNLYKFEIRHQQSGRVMSKIDPYATGFEFRPNTACSMTGCIGRCRSMKCIPVPGSVTRTGNF